MSTETVPTARGSLSERVGLEIKVAMVRAGISGRELARRLGVSQTWISTRLNGTTPLDLNDLQRIADALDIPIIQLLPSATRSATTELNGRLTQISRKDDLKPARHVTPRPFSPPRRDPPRPVSSVPMTRRRPRDTRPDKRPMAVAS